MRSNFLFARRTKKLKARKQTIALTVRFRQRNGEKAIE